MTQSPNPVIQKTKDYNQFHFINGNRPINELNVKRIMQYLVEDNQLHLHPILINKDGGVVDGQHRLMCAKQLGIDVWYIKDDNVSDKHIIAANDAQLAWDSDNFIGYYAKQERLEAYEFLQNKMKEMKIGLRALVSLLFPGSTRDVFRAIKEGSFELPDDMAERSSILDKFQSLMAFVQNRHIKPKSMFNKAAFHIAFRKLCTHPDFDMEFFITKLELKWFTLVPLATNDQWYNTLLKIYNYKNKFNKLEDLDQDFDE